MTTTTQHQPRTVIGDATVAELEGALRGTVVRPGDAGYDEARAIWNASHDRHPALIIRCAGTADVMKGVQFAGSQQLPIAVRGGAHSIAGFSTVDDGVVIDLSPMRGVTVDPVNRRAVVQGGATWREVDHETQAFGLAVTGGLVSSTGVGGFTLGGGIGWLVRKHGLSCDNLVSADVVTSDGELVHAGPGDNQELLWALRGGGGNFGIVTSFEYDLHPVGPDVTAGLIFFPGAAAHDVLRGWRDLTESMPRELTSLVNLTTAPPVPFLPEAVHGTPIVAIALMHCGPLAEGERAVAPLRALAEPIVDIVGPMHYAAMQQVLDPLWARGAHNYFTSAFIDTLSDEVLEEVIGRWQRKPTPQSELHLHHIAGAMGDVSAEATAFAHRSSPFICNVIARATDGQDFDSRAAWARAARDMLATYGNNGVYVNFTGDGDADKVRAAYPADTYARLAGVKRHYDPDNVFRLNQNISPTP